MWTMWVAIWISIVVLVVLIGAWGSVEWIRGRRRYRLSSKNQEQAKQRFRLRREWLEAEFLKAAAASGKPRGLRWVDCEFGDDVQYACDEEYGLLRAFVSLTVRFEAIEGGDMEEVEAVSNLRAATGVFEYDGDRWIANPRAIFNLSPNQAILHFKHRSVSID
ncbi:hypothetical protein [Bremerella sp.]|uniref:hypothetical protein n=1 Tax=Bremerella sp. TaxID=2795602 RepID=UPI00391A3C88|eukprot:CAMPEP_0201206422 /NCGR_PEP_ID=MMETSP0851-20130426/172718_1 /ASSEMBLY_ACC=CAM_ASM_000631 /TAXON_ID=183588 /ORGANISM="Pseudo-nitzschia fraudulenta, Strain WWA7" /LENGTH=162 /DNA_ID=CAMNT_0047494773 /DNA_START=68 /DNA_END=556 /DNA_ORIENTATION=+